MVVSTTTSISIIRSHLVGRDVAASPHDLKVLGSDPALATFLRDKPFDQQHNGLFPRDAKSYVIELAAQTSDSEDSAICTAIYLSQALQ